MFKYIGKWYEPLRILEKLPMNGRCEMTSDQLGFLCGMLRKVRPTKMLEVGVAAGGTSCVVLEALQLLCNQDNTESELYSVDLSTYLYNDSSKMTGYMVENMRGRITKVRHSTYYGAMLPEYISQIGGDIDLLLLDSAHVMPGEILDFLLALPFLKNNATVIVHDIMLSLIAENRPVSIATNVLLEAVSAEKYLSHTDDYPGGVDNIGGFVIAERTQDEIANVFMSLLKKWSYVLDDKQYMQYHELFSQHYDTECLNLFEAAVLLNNKQKQSGQ